MKDEWFARKRGDIEPSGLQSMKSTLGGLQEYLTRGAPENRPAPRHCLECGAEIEHMWVAVLEKWVAEERCNERRADGQDCCHMRHEQRKRDAGSDPGERLEVVYRRALDASGVGADRYKRFVGRRDAADPGVLAMVAREDVVSGYICGPRGERQLNACVLTETFLWFQIRKLERHVGATLLHVSEMFRRLKLGFDNQRGALSLADLQQVDLLVLDGVGTSGGVSLTNWECGVLLKILDERDACLRPTILLGDVGFDDLMTEAPYRDIFTLEAYLEQRVRLPGYQEVRGRWSEEARF